MSDHNLLLVVGCTALLLMALAAPAVGQAEANLRLAEEAVDLFLKTVVEDQRLKQKECLELRKELLEAALPFYERFAQGKPDDAEASFRLAREAVDRYLTAVAVDKRLEKKDFLELRKKLLATAVPFYERFALAKPDDPKQETARGLAYGRLAFVRQQLGETEKASADYERMEAVFEKLALNDAAVSAFRLQRAALLARTGQHTQATAAVVKVLQPGSDSDTTLYDGARVYALAAAEAAKQAQPTTSSVRAEQYARRAVALLRQAVQKGYEDIGHIKKDTDLDALRGRAEFKQLLAQLEAKTAGPGK
jgi:hypothetical protein